MSPAIDRRSALKGMLCGLASVGVPAMLPGRCRSLSPSPADEIEPFERTAMANVAEEYRRQFNAPGLSVAIARDGQLRYARAFGTVGRDCPQEVTPASLFRIASVSKPITSAAIFDLIEHGRLRLDDTVFGSGGVLGTRYGRKPYRAGIEQITIDHLLTHTSGGWDLRHDPMFRNPEMSQGELISWALDTVPLQNPPGKSFAYSNFGYCLLGRVIEKNTGLLYSDFVQKSVLGPSGITRMRIAGNTLKDRAPGEVTYDQQASGGGQDREDRYDDPYALNVTRMDSHGGWIAAPTDLVRFATHVDGFEPARNILKPETIRMMTTPCAANPNYARGWSVNAEGHWWHGGDLGGTSAVLVRTASRFCWAALTNTRSESSQTSLDDMMWELARKVSHWKALLG